jgi:hypothetical protein
VGGMEELWAPATRFNQPLTLSLVGFVWGVELGA